MGLPLRGGLADALAPSLELDATNAVPPACSAGSCCSSRAMPRRPVDAERPGGETRHMWSNARGGPRVNGGGPLAVLATSVCSGRGGRRLVSGVPRGAPPHTPATAHSGRLGALLPPSWGLCSVGCGGTRRLLALIRAKGEGAPSGSGGARGGCAGWAAGFPRRRSAPWRAAPAPPSPPPSPARGEGPEAADPAGAWGLRPHIKK